MCGLLTALVAVLILARLRHSVRRICWVILIGAGVTHAVFMSVASMNLINGNIVHYYLGAKYDIPYDDFYRVPGIGVRRAPISIALTVPPSKASIVWPAWQNSWLP